jgi:integrase
MKHLTKTPYGTRARLRINGQLHQRHFHRDVNPSVITEWLLKTQLKYGRRTRRTGKFKDDAAIYLAAVASMPTYAQRKQHIDDWVTVFGDEWRDDITPDMISAQLAVWKTNAANKRRTALMHLYSVLDGKSERNPVRDVPRVKESAPAPRAIAYPVIKAIFAAMPTSRSKAHLMTIAYTGLPPGIVAQLEPGNFDADTKTLAVPGRKKGAGTPGRILPLTPDGVKALKLMAKLDAWGTVSRTVLRRVLQRAAKTATGVEQFTPYDLRHSFGTEVYRRSGDIRATQILMGHSSPTLTHRYTLAAVEPRVKAALKGFGRK